MQSACAVLYCNLWPVRLYRIFPHYLTNGRISRKKKLLNMKCVFWFSLQLLRETFFIRRRIRRDNVTVHVTVNRVKFLIIKPTRCINFSNIFLEWNSTCFGQFLCPSLGVFYCPHSNGVCHTGLLIACEQERMLLLTSCQQTCMTCTIVVCTARNSWRWTEELSETCRVSFQKYVWEINASSWFYYNK